MCDIISPLDNIYSAEVQYLFLYFTVPPLSGSEDRMPKCTSHRASMLHVMDKKRITIQLIWIVSHIVWHESPLTMKTDWK